MNLTNATLPDYSRRGLSRVLPSIAAQFGVGNEKNTLSFPEANRYVVVLIDGLGWHQLKKYSHTATYLTELDGYLNPITCGVPSSTATSLTSLGTGAGCAAHGMAGYQFRNPLTGQVMNALSWEGGPADYISFQTHSTWFDKINQAGYPTANVALARFENSALTHAAMRGAKFYGVEDETDYENRVQLCQQAVQESQVVYFYERLLDHAGHAHGVGSWQWLQQLAAVDDLVANLRSELEDDVCLIVTADHGMINIDPQQYLVIEEQNELKGYDLVAGEARFRHIYTSDPENIKRRWAKFLGERAWVFTKEEGIAAGLFGDASDQVLDRLGDVMAAMRDKWVLMTETHRIEMSLIGVHGSLTAEEMHIPLLIAGPKHG
ncbi:MAG: alkaline phosphatase family protein [Propionibacterium sp.]|nr:MAG: alkaline phosphatase family protein [Propionibacterium sp.]